MSVTDSFQTVVLENLIQDTEYTRACIPYIKTKYFDVNHRAIFRIVVGYVKTYNKLPTASELELYFHNQTDTTISFTDEQRDLFKKLIRTITDKEISNEYSLEWLKDQTESWCKDRALYLAVMESIEILDDSKAQNKRKTIPDMLRHALSVSFEDHIGHDYMADAVSRWGFYNRKEDKIPFDIELLNTITAGGIPNKTLNIIISATGGGKTLFMCHCAASNLANKKNVLYITLEMAEERIAERIDSNLTNIPIGDIYDLSQDKYENVMANVSRNIKGSRLIIKEYPTGCANQEHFRTLLEELKIKKEFIPDIIYLDYLNIAQSSNSAAQAAGSYHSVKSVAEEVRAIAVEYNVPIVSATQANRAGYNNSDIDLENTSESYGINSSADLILALITTEELSDNGHIMVKQLKNRYNDPFSNKRFVIGVDRSRMKLTNVSDIDQPEFLPA